MSTPYTLHHGPHPLHDNRHHLREGYRNHSISLQVQLIHNYVEDIPYVVVDLIV